MKYILFILLYSYLHFPSYLIIAFFGSHDIYHYDINYNFYIILHILSIFVIIYFYFRKEKVNDTYLKRLPTIYNYNRLILCLYFVCSILFVLLKLGSSRHDNSFSEIGYYIFPVELIRIYFYAFLYHNYFFLNNKYEFSSYHLLLWLISSILSATGTFVIIQTILIYIIIYTLINKFNIRTFLTYSLLSLTIVFSVFYGFVNKRNMDYAKTANEIYNSYDIFLDYLIWRPCTMTYSIKTWSNKALSVDPLNVVLDESKNRLYKMFNFFKKDNSKYRSISHINYFKIFKNPLKDNSGTSPGLIANILMFLSYPYSCILLIILSICIMFLILYHLVELSLIKILFLLISTYNYFDSVFDLLIFPSNIFVLLVFYLFLLNFPKYITFNK